MNRLLPVLLSAVFAFAAAGQSSPTVSPDDPVYGLIDRLLAAGRIDSAVVGHRPWSEREVLRVLQGARRETGDDTTWIGRSLAHALHTYRSTPEQFRMGLEIQGLAHDSPGRGIPGDMNGSINGTINPLLANRFGRIDRGRLSQSAAVTVTAMPLRWLTIDATRRQEGADARGSTERLYARAVISNAAVTVGRDYVVLGQGSAATITNSMNAQGLDMIRVATERPFVLPWLFRHAGPVAGTIYLADLGRDQTFPHTRLFGYKLSARPWRSLEISTTLAEQVGGEGSPAGTFAQKATDAFPLIDALFLHRRFDFSNKFVGGDARLSVPGVKGLQLYMEGIFDDFDLRRARSVFTEDASYIWGASASCLPACGPCRIVGEYHVTGLRFYTHTVYANGFTHRGRFLGNQLGPRGEAGYLTIERDDVSRRLALTIAHEIRSGNRYRSISTTPDDSDFRFEIIEHRPAERRWRAQAVFAGAEAGSPLSLEVKGGVEHSENVAFISGASRVGWMSEATIRYRPWIGRAR